MDGYSCGLLAFNALAHSSNPQRYPLLDGGVVAADDAQGDLETYQLHGE